MIVLLNIIVGVLLGFLLYSELNKMLNLAKNKFQKTAIMLLAFEHFLAAFLFYVVLDTLPNNDVYKTIAIVQQSSSWFGSFSIGGKIMAFVCYPFLKSGIHMALLFFMFALISYKGITNYIKLIGIDRLTKVGIPIILLLFIPSFHFWTGYVGKDALTFTLLSYLLILIKNKYVSWKIVLVVGLLFIIRPHIALISVLAIWLTILFGNEFTTRIKLRFSFLVVLIGVLTIPIILIFFLKVASFNVEGLSLYVEKFIDFTEKEANTAISLSSTSFFERLFYLLLMPLPFLYKMNTPFLILAGIENVFVVVIGVYVLVLSIKRKIKFNLDVIEVRFAFIISILLAMLFAAYLYNLGLGNRMRVLFYPFIFYVIAVSYQLKTDKIE